MCVCAHAARRREYEYIRMMTICCIRGLHRALGLVFILGGMFSPALGRMFREESLKVIASSET